MQFGSSYILCRYDIIYVKVKMEILSQKQSIIKMTFIDILRVIEHFPLFIVTKTCINTVICFCIYRFCEGFILIESNYIIITEEKESVSVKKTEPF